MTQKEIAKRFIEVRDIIDFLDDGYHLKQIGHLIEISNELFYMLNETNQNKCREWLERKASE